MKFSLQVIFGCWLLLKAIQLILAIEAPPALPVLPWQGKLINRR